VPPPPEPWQYGFVALFSATDKASAQFARDTWRSVKREATLVGALATAAVAVPITVSCAVLWRFADKHADGADSLVEDPPSDDYRYPTRPRRRRFDSGPLRDSPVERRTAETAKLLVDATAYVEAAVRAAERAAGAKIAGDSDSYAARRIEAMKYARQAASPLHALGRSAPQLANEFEQSEDVAALPDGLPPGWRWSDRTLDSLMPQEALAKLYRSGIPLDTTRISLRSLPWNSEPVADLVANLRAAGEVSERFASNLQDWEAPAL
jgi:hypothetical protein